MKTTTAQTTRKSFPYPNAATFRHSLEKVVDLLLSAAICVGIAAILLFLLALS